MAGHQPLELVVKVRILPPQQNKNNFLELGRLAQLVERLVYTEKVRGSNPLPPIILLIFNDGGVPEWSNGPVLKTGVVARLPGVRIPPPPFLLKILKFLVFGPNAECSLRCRNFIKNQVEK